MRVPTPTRSPSGGVAHHDVPGRAAPTPQGGRIAALVALFAVVVTVVAVALVLGLSRLQVNAADQSPTGMSNLAVGSIAVLLAGAAALRWLFGSGR